MRPARLLVVAFACAACTGREEAAPAVADSTPAASAPAAMPAVVDTAPTGAPLASPPPARADSAPGPLRDSIIRINPRDPARQLPDAKP